MAEQSFESHAHQPVPTIIATLAACAGMGFVATGWTNAPTDYGLLLFFVAIMTLTSISRVYTTKLQDRIILLEMKVRCAELLPAGADQKLASLGTKQVVALRFASDAELGSLLDRAVAENLPPAEIKRAIQTWKPDLLRT
ncbi:MAG: DUF6526 family protein [Vicinamibacterales bacterium]